MAKRLAAKVGSYEKDGQTKGRYVNLGVILSSDNGEYLLLDPSVSLAGIYTQQMVHARKTGGKSGEKVMVSIFTDEDRQSGSEGGGYGESQSRGMDDEIPF